MLVLWPETEIRRNLSSELSDQMWLMNGIVGGWVAEWHCGWTGGGVALWVDGWRNGIVGWMSAGVAANNNTGSELNN